MPQNKQYQSGSALIYILVAVALFSMVMFTISRGNDTSTNTLSKAQTKIIASEIIEYSNAVANAVQKLVVHGCSENQISFENAYIAGYVNPNSPAADGKKCWVFDPAGGKVRFDALLKHSVSTPFYALDTIDLVGTTAPDLVMKVVLSNKDVCFALNDMALSWGSKPLVKGFLHETKYTGSAIVVSSIFDGADTSYHGKTSLCYQNTATPEQYLFYKVLLVR